MHYCGTDRQWAQGAEDGEPSLVWTDFGFSDCCEGIYTVGLNDRIARFGTDGLSLENSRGFDDPDDPVVRWDAGLFAPYIQLALATPPSLPAAGEAQLYVDPARSAWLRFADGELRELTFNPAAWLLTDGFVMLWDALAGQPEDSLIHCPGEGAVALVEDSYLQLPILGEPPPCPPEGFVNVWQSGEGLAAVYPDCEPGPPAECGWCGVDGGEWEALNLTCAEAEDIAFGQLVEGHCPEFEERWYRVPATSFSPYYLSAEELTGTLRLEWRSGESCLLYFIYANLTALDLPLCLDETGVYDGYLYVRIYFASSGGGDYSFTLGEGSCP